MFRVQCTVHSAHIWYRFSYCCGWCCWRCCWRCCCCCWCVHVFFPCWFGIYIFNLALRSIVCHREIVIGWWWQCEMMVWAVCVCVSVKAKGKWGSRQRNGWSLTEREHWKIQTNIIINWLVTWSGITFFAQCVCVCVCAQFYFHLAILMAHHTAPIGNFWWFYFMICCIRRI